MLLVVLSDEEVQAAVEYGHETASVEFKRALHLDSRHAAAVVARAAMALSNTRYGGHILLGVDDKNPLGPNSGISEDDAQSWLNHDNVMSKLNSFADPPLRLHCEVKDSATVGKS